VPGGTTSGFSDSRQRVLTHPVDELPSPAAMSRPKLSTCNGPLPRSCAVASTTCGVRSGPARHVRRQPRRRVGATVSHATGYPPGQGSGRVTVGHPAAVWLFVAIAVSRCRTCWPAVNLGTRRRPDKIQSVAGFLTRGLFSGTGQTGAPAHVVVTAKDRRPGCAFGGSNSRRGSDSP
jgi:hypothetical protein